MKAGEVPVAALSRRRFLGLLVATAGAPGLAAAGTGRKTLVGALEEDPSTLNTAVSTRLSSTAGAAPVYNALTHIPREGVVEPELAESWVISPDGKTYTFHLRRDVKWHDGQPFTSADVKFTIENVTRKYHSWGKTAYKVLDYIETPDDYTAIYHLKQPAASLLLCTDIAVGVILPKHLWDGTDILKNPHNQNPIGTGPYKLVEYTRGRQLRYERNQDYFVQDGSHFDEIIFRIIPDATSRLAAFEQGEIQMLYSNALPQAETPLLRNDPNVVLKKCKNRGGAVVAIFNTRLPELADARVRRALAHAIDRAFIRANVNGGTTSTPMVGPLWPSSALYSTSLTDYAFSPQIANELLDQAGFPLQADGTRFTLDILWPSYDMSDGKIADIMQRNLAAVGVAARLKPLDRATLNQVAYVANKFSVALEGFALGPDPDIGTERLYDSRNIINVAFANNSGYANPKLDALFDQQRVQMDPAKRKVIYDEIQQIIWRDLPVLSLYAYEPNNAYSALAVRGGLFEETSGAFESFVHTKPGIELANKTVASGSGSVGSFMAGAASMLAVGAGVALWRRSRATEAEEF
jgi:peptide/nickel transport system substrate-binding protein